MASTIANYQGNGSTTDFTVPFDYLTKKFVKVIVDSREKLGGDYGDTTKDYFFVDKTTIRFNTAPASGTEIIIRRYTSATDRIVSFKDASVLKAKDLDASAIQTIHIAEEGRDAINDAIIGDKEGNWDARGHRITNVGAPIEDNDAVNLKYYKKDVEGAYQARLNAEKARDAAKASEANAKSEADRAESEADRAKGYALQAFAGQLQADWNQTDSTQKDYIKNKPTIPTKTSQLTNDSGFLINSDIKPTLPMGHLFAWPYQTPPDGAIQCNGSTYSRVLYKDFWNYISSKDWVKTEGEWNRIASANGGYCPYYSTGDDSTTFRTPKFAPFMQIAIAGSSAGKYHKAGLPNIKGTFNASQLTDGSDSASGALIVGGGVSRPTPGSSTDDSQNGFSFDASKSNAIYGRSSTVQPESHEWMICVVVMGLATNIGSADVADVMQAVAQVQSKVNTTVKTINYQKPDSSGNISINTNIGFPDYTSYVTIASGDYTPPDNGWIRMELATDGDYQNIICTHKASGQKILYYFQARYPGDGSFMCPVCKNETYTLSGTQGKIWFHRCRG